MARGGVRGRRLCCALGRLRLNLRADGARPGGRACLRQVNAPLKRLKTGRLRPKHLLGERQQALKLCGVKLDVGIRRDLRG